MLDPDKNEISEKIVFSFTFHFLYQICFLVELFGYSGFVSLSFCFFSSIFIIDKQLNRSGLKCFEIYSEHQLKLRDENIIEHSSH